MRERYFYGGGAIATKAAEYDAVGRVLRVSAPFGPGETPIYTLFEYDELGRTRGILTPTEDGYWQYSQRSLQRVQHHMYDALGRRREAESDERGLLLRSVEYLEKDGITSDITTEYDYGPGGLLGEVRVKPSGSAAPSMVTTALYDRLGRRYQTTSPDRGTVTNRFNAFGEMREIVAADGATTTLRYDILGRIHERIAPEGTNTWTFNRAVNGIG